VVLVLKLLDLTGEYIEDGLNVLKVELPEDFLLLCSEGNPGLMSGVSLVSLSSVHAGSCLNLASSGFLFGSLGSVPLGTGGSSTFFCLRLSVNGRGEVGLGSSELALGLVDLGVKVADLDGLSGSSSLHGGPGLSIRISLRVG